jgi:hypothetical protein
MVLAMVLAKLQVMVLALVQVMVLALVFAVVLLTATSQTVWHGTPMQRITTHTSVHGAMATTMKTGRCK